MSEQEMMHNKLDIWTERKRPRPPRFFLTDAERKDKETLRIQHWLDLADMALGQTGETDCDEAFRPLRKLV